HLILAIFAHGSWADFGIDLVSLATFGWGRNLLRAGEVTVDAAGEAGLEGVAARAGSLSAGLKSGHGAVRDIDGLVGAAEVADDEAVTARGLTTSLPGILGKFADKAEQDFKPVDPATVVKTIRDADWDNVIGKQPVETIKSAVKQVVHMKSPEFIKAQEDLKQIPGLARIVKLTGINFPSAVTRYNHLWVGDQVGSLTIDAVDKTDSVLNYFHKDIPGYDWVKERAAT
ncbi:MAG: hypothetical protein ACRDNW_11925, partial [Trebonia sp.]